MALSAAFIAYKAYRKLAGEAPPPTDRTPLESAAESARGAMNPQVAGHELPGAAPGSTLSLNQIIMSALQSLPGEWGPVAGIIAPFVMPSITAKASEMGLDLANPMALSGGANTQAARETAQLSAVASSIAQNDLVAAVPGFTAEISKVVFSMLPEPAQRSLLKTMQPQVDGAAIDGMPIADVQERLRGAVGEQLTTAAKSSPILVQQLTNLAFSKVPGLREAVQARNPNLLFDAMPLVSAMRTMKGGNNPTAEEAAQFKGYLQSLRESGHLGDPSSVSLQSITSMANGAAMDAAKRGIRLTDTTFQKYVAGAAYLQQSGLAATPDAALQIMTSTSDDPTDFQSLKEKADRWATTLATNGVPLAAFPKLMESAQQSGVGVDNALFAAVRAQRAQLGGDNRATQAAKDSSTYGAESSAARALAWLHSTNPSEYKRVLAAGPAEMSRFVDNMFASARGRRAINMTTGKAAMLAMNDIAAAGIDPYEFAAGKDMGALQRRYGITDPSRLNDRQMRQLRRHGAEDAFQAHTALRSVPASNLAAPKPIEMDGLFARQQGLLARQGGAPVPGVRLEGGGLLEQANKWKPHQAQ